MTKVSTATTEHGTCSNILVIFVCSTRGNILTWFLLSVFFGNDVMLTFSIFGNDVIFTFSIFGNDVMFTFSIFGNDVMFTFSIFGNDVMFTFSIYFWQ